MLPCQACVSVTVSIMLLSGLGNVLLSGLYYCLPLPVCQAWGLYCQAFVTVLMSSLGPVLPSGLCYCRASGLCGFRHKFQVKLSKCETLAR